MKSLYLSSLFVFLIACSKKEDPSLPAVINRIFVSKITPTTVIIEWSAVKGAEGYRVYRINSLGSSFKVNAPLFEDTNLKNNTSYSYRVCAYNKYGEGPTSIAINAITSSPQRAKQYLNNQKL